MRAQSFLLRLAPLLSLAALLAMGGCLNDGGGSDTETLTGLVRTADGNPAVGAEVKLIPVLYNPSEPQQSLIRKTVTDADGRYRFLAPTDSKTGRYNLIVAAAGVDQGAIVDSLSADSVPATLTLERSRVFFISLHGDTYQTSDSGKAWMPGTDFFVRCEAAVPGKMDKVPRGISDLVIVSKAGWRQDYRVTNPGDSLIIKATRLEVQCQPY
jgi:5-hydroxyisourate hydrolase-like protein (transthyretin family)